MIIKDQIFLMNIDLLKAIYGNIIYNLNVIHKKYTYQHDKYQIPSIQALIQQKYNQVKGVNASRLLVKALDG